MSNSVGEREGRKVLWEEKLVSLGKKNGCLGEQMGNKKVCDNKLYLVWVQMVFPSSS